MKYEFSIYKAPASDTGVTVSGNSIQKILEALPPKYGDGYILVRS